MNKLLALYGIFDISNMFITTEGGKAIKENHKTWPPLKLVSPPTTL